MKKKISKQWFSMLMAAAVAVSSFTAPVSVSAAPEAAAYEAVQTADVREVNFNKGWKFKFGDVTGAEAVNFNDAAWEDEQLPHDFSITQEFSNSLEAESGFLPGGTGWYRKSFTLPAECQGKSIVLNFDGVYNHAYVYVNGRKLGENHYGYNDFAFEISDYVTCDGSTENVIAVKVVHQTPSSRWYSGSGIYRDVKLIVTGAVHVAKNGTYVTTPNLESEKNGNVTVNVKTKVQNNGAASANAVVRTTILDAQKHAVAGPAERSVTAAANNTAEAEQQISVNKPALWSCEDPNLYYVKTEILVNNAVTDTYETTFGFRYIKFDPNTGFSLNGKNVKMKGVCMHHDQGALGAAAYKDAVYRQVEILKEMGCNAIRTSHSTPADILLDACNELGVLVMDETYDGWEYAKNGNTQDFSTHFLQQITSDNKILGAKTGDTWYKFVLESNIERDKNDPSVVIWDIGNELNFGVPNSNHYVQYAENMIGYIKAIDATRPITSGDNNPTGDKSANPTDFRNQITKKLAESGGLAGMNYSMGQIAGVHSAHPQWNIVATETASPSNSRGIYSTLGQYSKTGDYQCTAYDTNAVSWGNTARESWWYTIKDDFVSGEFIWTGFDYIGEPTPWNGTDVGSSSGDQKAVPNSSFFGVIDTAGFPKDSFYFYTSQWREDADTLHIVPQSWNEEDLVVTNGKVPVYLYSNAAKVELYLNDVLIGTATRNAVKTGAGHEYATYTNVSNNADLCTAVNESAQWKKMAAQFSVAYQAGTLSAKAYDASGKLIEKTIGLDSVTTNSDAGSVLKMEAEKTEIAADGSSLSYIAVDVKDAKDQLVTAARNNIRFTLTGNGTIVGVDNGNPSTIDKFQQKSVLTSEKTANIDAFGGKALIIVRSTEGAGGFAVNAQTAGMKGSRVFVNTTGDTAGEVFLKEYEMTQEYTVRMGEKPELQSKVTGVMSDGAAVTGEITWAPIAEATYRTPGDYMLTGTLRMGGEELAVSADLHVKPIIAAMKNYARATVSGVVPALPDTVAAILPDGRSYGSYPVVWEEVKEADVAKVGTIVTVNGTATVEDGARMPVTATVRVAEGVIKEPVNIAPKYKTLAESCGEPADNLLSITDGVNNILNDPQKRWTNWNDHLLNSSPTITFTWEEVKEIDVLKAWFFGDANVSAPESVTIAVSADGTNFKEVAFTHTDYVVNNQTTITLDEVQKVKALRFTMKQVGTGYVGLTELEIWTTAMGYTTNTTAEMESLKINGTAVTGLGTGSTPEITVERADQITVEAVSKDNASVTVVPADDNNIVKLLVTSEDEKTTKVYEVKLNETILKADKALLESLKTAVDGAAGKAEADYTADSYAAYVKALNEAKAILAETGVRKADAERALANLNKALGDLVKKHQTPVTPPTVELPKVGSTFTYKNALYQVTKSAASDGTVTFVKPLKKTNKKVVVPAVAQSKGITFKVTAIAAKAMKGNKKLTQAVIGKNVTSIGASAFAGAKKLKKITVKSKVLKSVGRKAFKGIHAKCKIKVPKKKLKAYKKLMKKKGQKASVKITK